MHGSLGIPYRFFYSSKNYVSGLSNVLAKVKRPDDVTLGVYALVESVDIDFAGTYYFDLIASQLMPEGEYTIVIFEPSSGYKQISKVTLKNPDESFADFSKIDLIGVILGNGIVTGKTVAESQVVGVVSDFSVSGIVEDDLIINGKLVEPEVIGYINYSGHINGILKEEC